MQAIELGGRNMRRRRRQLWRQRACAHGTSWHRQAATGALGVGRGFIFVAIVDGGGDGKADAQGLHDMQLPSELLPRNIGDHGHRRAAASDGAASDRSERAKLPRIQVSQHSHARAGVVVLATMKRKRRRQGQRLGVGVAFLEAAETRLRVRGVPLCFLGLLRVQAQRRHRGERARVVHLLPRARAHKGEND